MKFFEKFSVSFLHMNLVVHAMKFLWILNQTM